MQDQEPPKIEFPCAYPIKVLGTSSDQFESIILEVFARHAPGFDQETIVAKGSSKGTFTSLTITITAKVEEETAFLIEVQQAGIFFITGFEGEDLRRIVGTTAPNILFPYARECIDTLCVKGGFPPVMLAPINFDAMYQQALAQAQTAPAAEGDAATH